MSHADAFWKLFWSVVLGFTLLYIGAVTAVAYVYNPMKSADAAAVGAIFDSSRDPFQTKRFSDARPKFQGSDFYVDDLPLAFADWSWGVRTRWISSEKVYEGSSAVRVDFLEDWSGLRVQATDIDITPYQGVALAVNASANVGDLYIELFDAHGKSFGKQSLGWYSENNSLSPNAWNYVRIPFKNLLPENQSPDLISGYAISTVHPGVAYIDSVRLEKEIPEHSKWYEPKAPEPEKPPAPIALPYTLRFTPETSSTWRTVFGRFDVTPESVRIGTAPEKSTGSMSYIRGGQNWTDYSVDTTLYWGQTSAFSILVRYVDDGNFISCAFSHYNETVQMYAVEKGTSRLLGTSPGLPIRAVEPWKDARAGASVQGKTVSCYVDGEKALSYEIPEINSTGSVGLETWTQNTYDAPHTLQALTVQPL